ncbi:MAG TPA: PDZ domain-containing protein, partial [Chitinophagaceae bacterium]|nr:PDZ domain-containing protein [Chitinophagaceae bacterium]
KVSGKLSLLILMASFLAPAILVAQEEEKEKGTREKKEGEQIIITRKGDKNEKMVIEINGDKITVNGKPASDLKDGDISVRRSKIRDVRAYRAYADGFKGQTGAFEDHFKMFSMDSNRAMLGVTTEKTEDGVVIQSITKESAAEKAGLKKGDIIRKINEKKIETPDQLSETIKERKPGDKIEINYLREKKEHTAKVELGKWKGSNVFSTTPGQNFNMDFNFDLDDIMPHLEAPRAPRPPIGPRGNWSVGGAPKLGISVQDTDDGKGVKVIEVDEDGNAGKAGLKEDDIITDVDGKSVNSADEIARVIRESREKNSVVLKLKRGGKTQNIEVKIPKRLKTADL